MRHRATSASRGLHSITTTAFFLAMGAAQPLRAQTTEDESQRLKSVLELEREGYEAHQIKVGGIVLSPELDVSTLFDSNVYAAHVDKQSDFVARIRPRLLIESGEGPVEWSGQVSGELRRYASTTRENSDSYGASGTIASNLTSGIKATATAGYRRAVENRADPEVRQNPTIGPPLFDVYNGELTLQGGRGKLGVSLKALAEKYNFVARANDDRDFTSYRATMRVLYQVAPAVSGFVQGYINQRDFRIRAPNNDGNRNGRTLGGLAGVQIDPGGKVRGDIGMGIFRYYPESSLFKSFSGFAIDGSLIYTPRARTAVIFDMFRGDVATVRNGASGRIDTRLRVAIQQEVRHNLVASAAVRYRQTEYRGVTDKLNTFGADLDLEYLIDHHFSLALIAQATKRTSRTPVERFERGRVGLELRVRY